MKDVKKDIRIHRGIQAENFSNILNRIVNTFGRVPRGLAKPEGLALRFNGNGTRSPIFWCFNSWAEPVLLANRLGLDYPLLALSSFNQIASTPEDKAMHLRRLASAYAQQLLETVAEDAPILIGGNCQAAPIAEAMAHQIISLSGRVPLLMMIENEPFYCYPGPLLLLFGNDSHLFNPFLQGADPRPRWAIQHGSVRWGFLGGKHGHYFMEPALRDLAAFVATASAEFCAHGRIAPGAATPASAPAP